MNSAIDYKTKWQMRRERGDSDLGGSHAVSAEFEMSPLHGGESTTKVHGAGPAAVSCIGVTKEFGTNGTKTLALRGVDLEVYEGQMTLLVGPSGCGKTTLISMVAGLLDPTQGRVSVLGVELARLPARRLVEFRARHIGFVFQQYNLLPALTAAENAAVPLIISGRPRAQAVAAARALLVTVGLAHRADSFPSQLSGGEQQRVAIARALINNPRLLVCDEPTSALDGRSGQTVMELIKQVAVQRGRAVIVVTHDSRVYDFGDRIVEMNDGRISGAHAVEAKRHNVYQTPESVADAREGIQ